jgi:hypothetical protein
VDGRPFSTLDAKRRLGEQARRYEEAMGRDKAAEQKRLSEAEAERERRAKIGEKS